MRKLTIIFVCCMAVLLGGFIGYKWYQARKQHHLITMAQQYLAKSDLQRALISLQLVLRSNPNDLEALRMQANIYEAAGSPASVAKRQQVVDLDPDSTDDKLALVQTAIVMRDMHSATNALASVSAEGRKTATYQNMAGSVAEITGQLSEAEMHFMEAARLAPNVEPIQLNLAKLRLRGTNQSVKPEARLILARIADNPTNTAYCCVALRELIADARRSPTIEAALALSKKLVQNTNSTFNDKLLRLDLLKKAGSPEFKQALAETERAAVKDGASLNAMAAWHTANMSLDSALEWVRSLPPNLQTNQPGALIIAQCLTFKQDWPALQKWVEKPKGERPWGEMEFMRHAFLSRAYQGLGLNASSETEWHLAVAPPNPAAPSTTMKLSEVSLKMLLRLAIQWRWDSKAEDLLWEIVNNNPGDPTPNVALAQILYNSGRTRSLMKLFGQQSAFNPADLGVKNNLAMCALLLDAQELKPNDLAHSLFETDPENPSFVSTYAFSLHLQKKDAEALKIIEKIKPEDLKVPSRAGYYGLILKATGNPVAAKKYLELSAKSKLLPEEQKLFSQAMTGL